MSDEYNEDACNNDRIKKSNEDLRKKTSNTDYEKLKYNDFSPSKNKTEEKSNDILTNYEDL